MATIDLGKIKLVWRGTYSGSTAYTVDDVVQHTDSGLTSSFICTTASTGNAPSTGGSVHSSWAYLAKGAAAYTSTLTTQGDVLYRDGSGEQRLAKGTAGQALIMNSGATAPEWGDAGGGAWTFISKTTVSDDATVEIDSGIDGTYPLYCFSLNDMRAVTDNAYLLGRVKTGGSWQSSSDYKWNVTDTRTSGGSFDNATQSESSGTNIRMQSNNGQGSASYESFNMLIYLPKPSSTVHRKTLWGEGTGHRADAEMCRHMFLGGYAGNADAVTGLQFYMNTNNIYSGSITLYGIKDS